MRGALDKNGRKVNEQSLNFFMLRIIVLNPFTGSLCPSAKKADHRFGIGVNLEHIIQSRLKTLSSILKQILVIGCYKLSAA